MLVALFVAGCSTVTDPANVRAPATDPAPVPTPTPTPSYNNANLVPLHVSPNGNDDAAGSDSAPLKSIRAALEVAFANRSQGNGTRIILADGTYREMIDGYGAPDGEAPIVIEAATQHGAIITGSDVWTGWQCSGGVCTHGWPYQWGAEPNPWPSDIDVGEIARRREVVFVDGHNLDQVMDRASLAPGSFFVDEGASLIYLAPPSGTSLADAAVEVGVRPTLYDGTGFENVALRGLVFEHAASAFLQSALYIGSRTTLQDVDISWNGQTGAYISGDNISLLNTSMNDNGGDGFAVDRARQLLFDTTETSRNNWRGIRGGFDDWAVGQKLAHVHGGVIRNHTSVDNFARGLWFDWDNKDILVDNLVSCGNTMDGLRLEGSQGPLTVTNSTLCENQRFGMSANGVHNLTFTRNTVNDNLQAQVYLVQELRHVQDFETGETYDLTLQDWHVHDNLISGKGDAFLWGTVFWDRDARARFLSSSNVDENTYVQPDRGDAFNMLGSGEGLIAFPTWQEATQQDARSTFQSSALASR